MEPPKTPPGRAIDPLWRPSTPPRRRRREKVRPFTAISAPKPEIKNKQALEDDDPFVEKGEPSIILEADEDDKKRDTKAKVYQSILLEHHQRGAYQVTPIARRGLITFPPLNTLHRRSPEPEPEDDDDQVKDIPRWPLGDRITRHASTSDNQRRQNSLGNNTHDLEPIRGDRQSTIPFDPRTDHDPFLKVPATSSLNPSTINRNESSHFRPDISAPDPPMPKRLQRLRSDGMVELSDEDIEFVRRLEDGSFRFRRRPL